MTVLQAIGIPFRCFAAICLIIGITLLTPKQLKPLLASIKDGILIDINHFDV